MPFTSETDSMHLDAFLQAMIADPLGAPTTWLVLADWLEEHDDPRFELVRLLYQPGYRADQQPEQRDARIYELLASGMEPVVPAIENSLGMRFALIPSGTFNMGAPDGVGEADEHPQHAVEISRPFFLGTCTVTQEQYQTVMGSHTNHFSTGGEGGRQVEGLDSRRFPVEMVSWGEARAFCDRLAKLPEHGKSKGWRCRLPTEAEWEHAARAGERSYSPFAFGRALSSSQANFDGNYPYNGAPLGIYLNRTTDVASYRPNAWGLYDMHGNVWEWCLDWYREDYYQRSPRVDPLGPPDGPSRVAKGGAWYNNAFSCRSARRGRGVDGDRYDSVGFRVVLVPPVLS